MYLRERFREMEFHFRADVSFSLRQTGETNKIERMIKSKIYAIPLPKLDGYGYVKIKKHNIFGMQVNVFDVFSKELISLDELYKSTSDYLVYSMTMNGEPRTRKFKQTLVWKYLGEDESSKSTEIITYKSGSMNELAYLEDWNNYTHWSLFTRLEKKNQYSGAYHNIRHLPIWLHSNYISISNRIEIFWGKKLNFDIEELFSHEISETLFYKFYLREVNNTPFYSDVPKDLHNVYNPDHSFYQS